MSFLFWILLACHDVPMLIEEPLVLTGDGVLGQLSPAAGGCGGEGLQIMLWGPTWGTAGAVRAEASEESGVIWVSFPIQTGVGEGVAALRIQGDDVRMPLGARSGEFDLVLTKTSGRAKQDDLLQAEEVSVAGIAHEQAAWQAGLFLLMDGEERVGEVVLRGESPPMVSVHDLTWLTPEPVVAARADDGGDLLLVFPVEPTLEDEEALLRINVLTRQVVVPSQAIPAPVDRRLMLAPGSLSDAEREQAVADAVAAADAAERAWLYEAVPGLARKARRSGGCASWEEMPAEWRLMLAGYEVEITESDGECALDIAPDWSQHRRRFSGVITAESEPRSP